MHFDLRPWSVLDVNALAALDAAGACGQYLPPWGHASWLHHVQSLRYAGVVARVGKDVAGYIVFEPHGHSVTLERLCVLPRWRNYGVGGRLLDDLRACLRLRNLFPAVCRVHERDVDTQRWLARRGWRALHVLRRWNDPDDAYLMQLDGADAKVTSNKTLNLKLRLP